MNDIDRLREQVQALQLQYQALQERLDSLRRRLPPIPRDDKPRCGYCGEPIPEEARSQEWSSAVLGFTHCALVQLAMRKPDGAWETERMEGSK